MARIRYAVILSAICVTISPCYAEKSDQDRPLSHFGQGSKIIVHKPLEFPPNKTTLTFESSVYPGGSCVAWLDRDKTSRGLFVISPGTVLEIKDALHAKSQLQTGQSGCSTLGMNPCNWDKYYRRHIFHIVDSNPIYSIHCSGPTNNAHVITARNAYDMTAGALNFVLVPVSSHHDAPRPVLSRNPDTRVVFQDLIHRIEKGWQ